MSQSAKLVLVTGTSLVPAAVIAGIRDRGFRVRHVEDDQLDADGLAQALEGAHGYLIGGFEAPLSAHFDAADELEAVAWTGTDYRPHVPGWPRAVERGVALLAAPGANAVSVAEFTLLLMLAVARPMLNRIALPGREPGALSEPGLELSGRRLGIIGLGRIGAHVARMARFGLGMEIAHYSPRRNEPVEAALGVRYMAKHELLRQSHVVSLHRPGPAPGERPELGKPELNELRDGAIVLNVSHPGLVDHAALLQVCHTKGIRAAFDGVGEGPEWDALTALGPERFLATGQMGFHTHTANQRACAQVADELCAILS
jgi:D-3-phosphoglycerate dehydrogenase